MLRNQDDKYTTSVGESLSPVYEEHVRNVIRKSIPQTCSLDTIWTALFVERLDELLPMVTHIINSFLVCDVFPSEFKTAIVKPLPP